MRSLILTISVLAVAMAMAATGCSTDLPDVSPLSEDEGDESGEIIDDGFVPGEDAGGQDPTFIPEDEPDEEDPLNQEDPLNEENEENEEDEEPVIVDDNDDDDDAADEQRGSTNTQGQQAGTTATQANYRVFHWNIAGGKENGCQTAGITRAVRRFVNQHNADFVGLNEVCRSQYEAIREALRQHWGKGRNANSSAYVGDGTDRVVGNAIFSRFNIEDVTRLKVGEDRYGDRNLLCGKVRNQPHLRFCSVHLTPGDATARVQLGRVKDRIEQWWQNRNDTVILAGDLNLLPNDPGLNSIYHRNANTRNNGNNTGRYRELDDNDAGHCRGYGERSVPHGNGGP